jgi:hypothetical protein
MSPMSPVDGAEGEDSWDIIEEFRYRTSLPLGRWLINRRRRARGQEPFPFFLPRDA